MGMRGQLHTTPTWGHAGGEWRSSSSHYCQLHTTPIQLPVKTARGTYYVRGLVGYRNGLDIFKQKKIFLLVAVETRWLIHPACHLATIPTALSGPYHPITLSNGWSHTGSSVLRENSKYNYATYTNEMHTFQINTLIQFLTSSTCFKPHGSIRREIVACAVFV
jgi:hypothetical protein